MKWIGRPITLFLIMSLSTEPSQQSRKGKDFAIISKRRDIHCVDNSMCPTWNICNAKKKICQCGEAYGDIVHCDAGNLISLVINCNCMTYEEETTSTYAGSCFYNCANQKFKDFWRVYIKLPTSPKMLINESACTNFHRTGLLCGDCEDGYSPLVLSYNLSCVKCPDGNKNWWKFILVAFVPLTFFYFFVVLFNINVTSSRLHGVVGSVKPYPCQHLFG